MTDKDESVSMFYKGKKTRKNKDGSIDVFDITNPQGIYRLMYDGEIEEFYNKHF